MALIKTAKEIELMRESGRLLGELQNRLIEAVKPGITVQSLEDIAAAFVKEKGVIGAFVNYPGTKSNYKHILCTSVNEEVVHCPPTERILNEGDIISIDAGLIYQGYYSDCAVTVPVGKVSAEAQKLINVTRDALYVVAQKQLKPGNTTGDIGYAIQQHVESNGFQIVKQLVGHGIGTELHEDPSVPNYGRPGSGVRLQPGMTIAIEPMVNISSEDVIFAEDGWRVVSADGKISAHFEHTYLITETGYEVLTAL